MIEQSKLSKSGIRLFSIEEKINLEADSFITNPRDIPDLGRASLTGVKNKIYKPNEVGISLENGKITYHRSRDLSKSNMFEINIVLQGVKKRTIDPEHIFHHLLTCETQLPNVPVILQSRFDLSKDALGNENNENITAITQGFAKPHFYFYSQLFVPSDAKFLSGMVFAFRPTYKSIKHKD